ncbi:MAG: M1 family aminopeptidase/hydrolase, partial [Acidobacteriota bacterium]|nr:M1 family aminopeptidase/hydrolase [Acidobacteriota bacterium]
MLSRLAASRIACVAVAAAALLAGACGAEVRQKDPQEVGPKSGMAADPHSYSRPGEVAVTHLSLDVAVDFDAKRISGAASLTIDNRSGATELVLDTRDLEIRGVSLGDERRAAAFELGEPAGEAALGRPLTIAIDGATRLVHVDYATRPEAAALQWLAPEQTAGGTAPFLYTQGQAILTRTWVPCQDSPRVRMTYDATVRVPPGLLAVMSAESPTEPAADGVHTFRMPQPIPAYLLALAVGDLRFAALGPRTGVYAEPPVLKAAAYEFADTEKMMEATERLYGPYRWGRYDLLVLPPSFPFGGMENPRLAFLTPTILAGDRSLNALVAHELAHSWSGNLVTNATWNDLWLNEGFTVYVERRVMEELYGRPYADMLRLLGRQDLDQAFEETGRDSPDTRLAVDLAGRDPDDAFGDVPYEKGSLFLEMLERKVGRERFDDFLRAYFDRFAFQSLDTDEFARYLREALIDTEEHAGTVMLDAWLHGTGLPDDAPEVQSDAFEKVRAQLAGWRDGGSAGDLETGDWNTHQWLHFLRQLPYGISQKRMRELDD